jgi:hypothetical protein
MRSERWTACRKHLHSLSKRSESWGQPASPFVALAQRTLAVSTDERVVVYSFTVWSRSEGRLIAPNFKATAEFIARVQGERIEASAETIGVDVLDEARRLAAVDSTWDISSFDLLRGLDVIEGVDVSSGSPTDPAA